MRLAFDFDGSRNGQRAQRDKAVFQVRIIQHMANFELLGAYNALALPA